MPRIRTIKPSFFCNEFLAELPMSARMLFIGLFCFADRDGRMEDRPKRIKAQIFPFDNADVNDLLSRLQSAGFIYRYEVGEMKVIQIVNFSKHQRITGTEALSKSEFPQFSQELNGDHVGNNLETTSKQLGNNMETPERSIGKGVLGKGKDRANALVVSDETERDLKKSYDDLTETLTGKGPGEIFTAVKTFVSEHKPAFAEPYVDAWNLFSLKYSLAQVREITAGRRAKIRTRVREEPFDFFQIIKAIGKDDFLKGESKSGWKVDFDYVIASQSNYIKIIEKL